MAQKHRQNRRNCRLAPVCRGVRTVCFAVTIAIASAGLSVASAADKDTSHGEPSWYVALEKSIKSLPDTGTLTTATPIAAMRINSTAAMNMVGHIDTIVAALEGVAIHTGTKTGSGKSRFADTASMKHLRRTVHIHTDIAGANWLASRQFVASSGADGWCAHADAQTLTVQTFKKNTLFGQLKTHFETSPQTVMSWLTRDGQWWTWADGQGTRNQTGVKKSRRHIAQVVDFGPFGRLILNPQDAMNFGRNHRSESMHASDVQTLGLTWAKALPSRSFWSQQGDVPLLFAGRDAGLHLVSGPLLVARHSNPRELAFYRGQTESGSRSDHIDFGLIMHQGDRTPVAGRSVKRRASMVRSLRVKE